MSREDHEDLKTPPRTVGQTSVPSDSASDERTVNNTMRHQYRILSDEEKADMLAIKDLGLVAFNAITDLEKRYGGKREYSIAKTKVEEAVMWAVRGITE